MVEERSCGVIIRGIAVADSASKVELERRLVEDGRGMVLGPAQVPDLDEERARIASVLAAPDDVIERVAVDEAGLVVATAQLRRLAPARCHHVGLVMIGVHPDHQARGIGRRLMETLMGEADSRGFLRLELYVRADNARAIRLYQAVGFTIESTRERFVRLDDGRFVDDLIMVRFTEAEPS